MKNQCIRGRKSVPKIDVDYRRLWFFKNILNLFLKVAGERAVIISWLNLF